MESRCLLFVEGWRDDAGNSVVFIFLEMQLSLTRSLSSRDISSNKGVPSVHLLLEIVFPKNKFFSLL